MVACARAAFASLLLLPFEEHHSLRTITVALFLSERAINYGGVVARISWRICALVALCGIAHLRCACRYQHEALSCITVALLLLSRSHKKLIC